MLHKALSASIAISSALDCHSSGGGSDGLLRGPTLGLLHPRIAPGFSRYSVPRRRRRRSISLPLRPHTRHQYRGCPELCNGQARKRSWPPHQGQGPAYSPPDVAATRRRLGSRSRIMSPAVVRYWQCIRRDSAGICQGIDLVRRQFAADISGLCVIQDERQRIP